MSENATQKKLTAPQHKAIEALLTAGNVTKAAEAANVTRKTLYRWLKDATFVAALTEAEAEALARLQRALLALGVSAIVALNDALQPHQKITTRLRASETVITNLLRLRELVDIERRLAALEGKNE